VSWLISLLLGNIAEVKDSLVTFELVLNPVLGPSNALESVVEFLGSMEGHDEDKRVDLASHRDCASDGGRPGEES
jgi:hypothetical protein